MYLASGGRHGLDCMSHYGSWIYFYLCNQCLSPIKLWVRILLIAMCTQSSFNMW